MVFLIKILDGKPAIGDALPSEQVVRCPRCDQTYRFSYSGEEWYKVTAWLKKAETVMRESHNHDNHELDTLELIWRTGINR